MMISKHRDGEGGGCLQAFHAASTDQLFRINLHLIVPGIARPLLQNHACPSLQEY